MQHAISKASPVSIESYYFKNFIKKLKLYTIVKFLSSKVNKKVKKKQVIYYCIDLLFSGI